MVNINYWQSYGIHTRVQNLINHCGGLDFNERAHYLAKTYNIPVSDAWYLMREPVEEYIQKGETIEDIINAAKCKDMEATKRLGRLAEVFGLCSIWR